MDVMETHREIEDQILLRAQNGDLRVYMALFVAQAIVCITATATVFSRVVVQYIENARGLALAIAASGPALTGIFMAPLLNNFVETHGWREGYVVAAAFGGMLFLLLKNKAARKENGSAGT